MPEPKVTITLRCDQTDRELAELAARLDGVTLSTYLARLLPPAVREDLLQRRITASNPWNESTDLHTRRSQMSKHQLETAGDAAFAAGQAEGEAQAERREGPAVTPAQNAANLAEAAAITAEAKRLGQFGSAPGKPGKPAGR